MNAHPQPRPTTGEAQRAPHLIVLTVTSSAATLRVYRTDRTCERVEYTYRDIAAARDTARSLGQTYPDALVIIDEE